MKFGLFVSAFTALLTSTAAQKVSGAAEGFAQGVTGGGSAAPVTPRNIQELVTYLTDKSPRVIVLDRTYDFTGSEGTPAAQVTYDKAGTDGINVASDKTIIGVGNKGIIKGKGLRFVNVKNIIVQNIHVTNLNPQYVWGGDAFAFSGTSKIWVDHCTTFEMVGQGDQITLQNNYIIHTSGRGPALSATTLLHAVNNVWSDVKGHAIEGDTAGKGLFEGNVFLNVNQVIVPDFKGQLNSCPDTAAAEAPKSYLGRVCQGNIFSGSSAFSRKDTEFLSEFKGLPIARSTQAKTAQAKVPQNAGFGKI
ncbi:hypothetical protein MRS44_011685 [Fusarium solani]|uniref:uncharacterized protein n=1 Tax=Fusarium solani TaxID=169388 RepID=UPI0032C3FFF9|nr:hypothetical protein MRS44_011685 [Fusarium solani]